MDIMDKYYICKIGYMKVAENGTERKVVESCVVAAVSFTEAEARITGRMTEELDEFEVADIRRTFYRDVVAADDADADGNSWYSCRLEVEVTDGRTGAVKTRPELVLVQASSLEDAMKRMTGHMRGTMTDYDAVCIKKTSIQEVYGR